MRMVWRVGALRASQAGYALLSVLIAFLTIQLIGVGILTVVTSDIHGAIANHLAVQALNAAEAGANLAVAQGTYGGFGPQPIDLGSYQGTFQGTVTCTNPVGATSDNECLEKQISSTGSIGRARRKIDVRLIKRTPSDSLSSGFCGRDGIGLDRDSTLAVNAGSNADINILGPSRGRSQIRSRAELAPAPGAQPTADGIPPSPPPAPAGLNGDYAWRVTYVYRFAGSTATPPPTIESGLSDPTATTTLTNQYGRLTNIPQSGDSNVIRRRIYRSGAGAPGAWYFVAEIPPDNASLPDVDPDPGVVQPGFIDTRADDELFVGAPNLIVGNAFAGGKVNCSDPAGCPNGSINSPQVDGESRWGVRDPMCPAFTPPPCTPGSSTPSPLPTSLSAGTYTWGALTLGATQTWDLTLPPSTATTTVEIHIHVSSLIFERDTRFVVFCSDPNSPYCGKTRLFFHVAGPFQVGQRSWFGVNGATVSDPDSTKRNSLLWPGDRITVISCAQDGHFLTDASPSVLWNQDSRVSALIFAPNANISVNQAGEFIGSLYGQHLQIDQATGFVLDMGRGFTGGTFQATFLWFLSSWYDDPRP